MSITILGLVSAFGQFLKIFISPLKCKSREYAPEEQPVRPTTNAHEISRHMINNL